MNEITELPEGKYDVQILIDEKVEEMRTDITRNEAITLWRTWYAHAFNAYSVETKLVLRALNRKTGSIVRVAI